MRSIATVAPMAFAASAVSARKLLDVLVPAASRATLAEDQFAAQALPQPDSTIAIFNTVVEATREYFGGNDVAERAQFKLTKLFDDSLAAATLETCDASSKARISSASAPFASAWLAPLPGSDMPFWLPGSSFVALLRLRLGFQVAPVPDACVLCKRPNAADVWGHHSVTCGNKYAIHNTVRDAVANLFGDALMAPRLEPQVFPDAPGRRGDIAVTFSAAGRRRRAVIDISVVSPFAVARQAAAARAPGGAAEDAAKEKITSYGELPERAGMELVPMCIDSLGAWNAAAVDLLKRAARDWGKRFDIKASRAIPLAFSALSTILAQAVARLLLANSGVATALPTTGPTWNTEIGTETMENPSGGPTSLRNRFAERRPETNAVQAELARPVPPPAPATTTTDNAADTQRPEQPESPGTDRPTTHSADQAPREAPQSNPGRPPAEEPPRAT